MSAKEMYDYISVATPDNDVTLSLAARGNLVERGTKKQVVHLGEDGSEERISLSDTSVFYLTYPFDKLRAADAGTVMDFWHDAAKGNGMAETFKLSHSDGHVYVVRFDCDMERAIRGVIHSISVVFKIIGRIADA